jgi:hypothetical protein
MRALQVVLLLSLSLLIRPAWAWHIAGTVYCDANDNHSIDGGDTELSGYTVKLTSQSVSPGTSYTT